MIRIFSRSGGTRTHISTIIGRVLPPVQAHYDTSKWIDSDSNRGIPDYESGALDRYAINP